MTPVHRTSVLSPSSVVVVGGSDRFGSVGKVVVDNILSGGFSGEVFVVNPRTQSIAGARWLANVDELPPGVDLAVVVTPAARVPEIIAKLGAREVSAAMVISTGVTSASGLREPMLAAAAGGLGRADDALGPEASCPSRRPRRRGAAGGLLRPAEPRGSSPALPEPRPDRGP